MRDTIEGQGQLENWDHPDKAWAVRYRFDITTEYVERPGLPRVAARRRSSGFVRSTNGEVFPDGYYRLHAADGEILKVQSHGEAWVILAS
jgi:hypothetical protein